jgi:hypothetical protein
LKTGLMQSTLSFLKSAPDHKTIDVLSKNLQKNYTKNYSEIPKL